jgi:uncharacterized protein YjiK
MFARTIQIVLFGVFLSFICFAGQNETETGELIVQSEAKLNELLRDRCEEDNLEASGVLFLKNEIFVVFDNCKMVAKINFEINKAKLLGEDKNGGGYEGITYDNINDRFYLIEESLKNNGAFNARLNHANKDFIIKSKNWLKYNFQSANKGFEGLTFVTKNNKTYILALCEGNECDAGKISKIHGAGRIKVFEKKKEKWKYIASIRIPQSLEFVDYSGIDINEQNILAITSQESSAVWVAGLDVENWQIDDTGTVYYFPKHKNGNKTYCNIEGVAWVANNRLVVVSDAKKKTQPDECQEKEQSIHIVSMEHDPP